ncbi:MAG: enoyl-CoA hydratase/isomerase family protein [Solirubrobacterales bacterium]
MEPTFTADPPELSTISLEIDGPIATMTLDRPDSMNAMNIEMIQELPRIASWLADAGEAAGIRALVVTGAGHAFSAGGDVSMFREGLDDENNDLSQAIRYGADVLHQAIVDFRRIPFPVVAAVNGAAAGAGFSLSLMCDTRLASENAFFVVAYGRIGASPDGGMTYFLPRLLGPARATELMLNDPIIRADDALQMGIVAEVVDHDALADTARAKAEELGAKAPHYTRMVKKLVAQSLDNSLADHLQIERHGIADSMRTEDLKTGVYAFMEGETPEFTGR